MNIKNISAVVFSPTNSTKEVVSKMATYFPLSTEIIDITAFSERNFEKTFSGEDLVIFAVPVYGGRVPSPAVERIKNIKGNKTPAVLIATYGNREYDDALLEMKNCIEKNGFTAVAAAAFITEHSIMHSVAKGRPDDKDEKIIAEFSKNLWDKINNSNDLIGSKIEVDGNFPYKEYGGVPLKPQSTKKCTKCGLCAKNCPVNAISANSPDITNNEACISCMRCIKICPNNARKLNGLMLAVAEKAFAKKNSARKEPKLFL
ncbi:MAG: EFR1 family ferrodoxin [Oscillospiraceae bacterium]